MTAQDLFELLNPLWLKHPGTRPIGVRYVSTTEDWLDGERSVGYERIIERTGWAIVKWLGERDGGVSCAREGNDWLVEVGHDRLAIYIQPSLLSALVSAAMAMEAE